MFLQIENRSNERVGFQYDSPDFYWVTLFPQEGKHLFSVKLKAGLAYEIESTSDIMPAAVEAELSKIRQFVNFRVVAEKGEGAIKLLETLYLPTDTGIETLITNTPAVKYDTEGTLPVWDENSYHNL